MLSLFESAFLMFDRLCSRWGRGAIALLLGVLVGFGWMPTSEAARRIDPYVRQYLKAAEPVEILVNAAGETQTFTPDDLIQGKESFSNSCLTCHVGGSTLSNPSVSLSLEDLHNATPPRDNLENLVQYIRRPMFYDGLYENDWCREVPESWMSDTEVNNMAAFILRAAEFAPGWGTERFTN